MTTKKNKANVIELVSTPNLEAFERYLPKMRELQSEQLLIINLDIPTAVTQAFRIAGKLGTFRSQVLNELPHVSMEAYDNLEDIARALAHAHACYLAAQEPSTALPDTLERALPIRQRLFRCPSSSTARSSGC